MTDSPPDAAASESASSPANLPTGTASSAVAVPPASTAAVAVGADAPPPTASSPRLVWAALNNPFALGFYLVLGGLAAFALGVAFSNLSTVIIYVVLAMFVALALDPGVRWLQARGMSRAWAIVIVYAAFAVVVVLILWLIIPTVVEQITQLVQSIPTLIADFQKSDVYAWLNDNLADQLGGILSEIQSFLTNPANIAGIAGGIVKIGVGIGTAISGLIVVLVLSLYFLAGLTVIKQSFTKLVPARNRVTVASMTDQITDSIGGYLMGMVVLAFFNSMVALALFFFLGLPFPPLMAVVAFSVTLIPLVGSVLFWLIGSVFALIADPVAALVFAAVYLIYMQLEAYVLTPRVMSRAISVPGSLVVIGALVGGTLLGLLGALVAIPVAASILLIIKQVVIPRQDQKT